MLTSNAVCQCLELCVSTDGWTHCVLTSTTVCQCLGVVCVNRRVDSLSVNEYYSVSLSGCCVRQQAGGLTVC